MIRKVIERDFLERILQTAQNERSCTNFTRTCLFCKKVFTQTRAQLFDHLYHDHNFFLGHPDNIIDANDLLDILEGKLKLLQCLYCEKNFKSWNVLKEHMRKKAHKLLNPNNREYDRFYLINYLCSDKHWLQIKEVRFYCNHHNAITISIPNHSTRRTTFTWTATTQTTNGTIGWRMTSKTVYASFARTRVNSRR